MRLNVQINPQNQATTPTHLPPIFAAGAGGLVRRWLSVLAGNRWRLLASCCVLLLALLFILDKTFPLNLPGDDALFARVVTDSSGRPLRVFPDHKGVWRYAIKLDEVA